MSAISLATAPSFSVRPISTSMSFRDQAYAMLKEAIANANVYEQHDEIRLDEKELSLALGVSRTPVREAMTLLEREGFLRTLPRRGIFIVRKTKKDIVDMIRMWAALESMSARLATIHAPDQELAGLRHMFDSFVDATPAAHLEEYSDANLAFHQAIVRLGGAPIIVETVQNLLIHVRAIRKMTISQDDRATRSIVDHMKIIDALERRETELAERLVRQHTLDLASYVERYCDFLA